MLGRHAGAFRVGPVDIAVPADVRYLPGTMILETSWGTPSGWIIVRDALLIGPWHHDSDRSRTYRRTPNDYEAEHILLRTIRCASGEVQTIMDCEPVLDYGRKHVRWSYTGDGYYQAICSADGTDLELTLTSDLRIGFEGGQASARTLLKEGDVRFVALSWGGAPPPADYSDAYQRQVWTAHHWQHWLARGQFPDHPWRNYLQRSALTLKGLTYAPTGAVDRRGHDLAARDTGWRTQLRLPVQLDPRRHVRAVGACTPSASTGRPWTSSASSRIWWRARTTSRSCTASAERRTSPRTSSITCPGYANSRPVRIGNAAYAQKQHDVWGALLDSVYLHFKAANHLDNRIWPILDRQVTEALKHWREPDAGIWEVRGEPQHFTSSKIMCWVAVDRGAKIARMTGEDGKAASGSSPPQEIKDDILANGVDERGVLHPVLRHQGAGRLAAARAPGALPAGRRPADPGDRAGDRRRADRPRAGAALQGRGDRRRLLRRGGQLHDLLVLAGLRAVRDRGVPPGPQALREAAVVRRPAGAVRARRSTRTPASTSATSRRRSPTWP